MSRPPDDVDRLMRVTGPEVGLLHDTGHVTFAGGDAPTELAEARRARVPRALQGRAAAAWRGWRAIAAGASSTRCSTARSARRARAASISPRVVAILRDAGYRGWLVVEGEQDPAVAPAYRYADMAYRLLRALVAGKPDAEARAAARRAGGIDERTDFSSRPRAPGATIARVTPESAGWRYVGFEALSAGARRELRRRDGRARALHRGRRRPRVGAKRRALVARPRPAREPVRGRRAARGVSAARTRRAHHRGHRRRDRAVHGAGDEGRRAAADRARRRCGAPCAGRARTRATCATSCRRTRPPRRCSSSR